MSEGQLKYCLGCWPPMPPCEVCARFMAKWWDDPMADRPMGCAKHLRQLGDLHPECLASMEARDAEGTQS